MTSFFSTKKAKQINNKKRGYQRKHKDMIFSKQKKALSEETNLNLFL
jgi:hypothetical protein